MSSKRGLLAPQNTFLDSLRRRIAPHQTNYIIANAELLDYPIVHCSEAFANLFGYSRSEIMFQPASCSFMRPLEAFSEDAEALELEEKVDHMFKLCIRDSIELPMRRKDRKTIWVNYSIGPIYNEKNHVAFYFCWVKNMTRNRVPLVEPQNMRAMSRFARMAKTVTANRKVGQADDFETVARMALPSANGAYGLLNENNEVSSEPLLPKYQLESPQVPPYTILHTSNFKQTWNWAIFMLTVYTALTVPFELVYTSVQQDTYIEVINMCVDAAFIIDIIISFRTTFVGNGMEVVSDFKSIRNHYIRGWFLIDLASSIPLEMIDIIYQQFKAYSNVVIRRLRLLKMVRLLRLFRVLRRIDHYMEYAGGQLLLFISIFILVSHWFALVWFAIGEAQLDMDYGWLKSMDTSFGDGFTKCCGNNNQSVFVTYVSSLYFTMTSMTTIGFGNISGNTDMEKLFCIALMFIGSLIYAGIFGNFTTIFQQLSSQTTRYHNMLNDIRDFMHLYEVPNDLGDRVMDYAISTWANTKGVNTEEVLSYTPKDMRADLCIHLNRQVLREHPAFRLASEGCLRALAIAFQMQHNAPGDLLFHTGESIEELVFIANGSLEILQDDEIVALVGKGDVIGDDFWKEPNLGQSVVTVRALTYTDVHIIPRDALLQILNFYEGFSNSFERNLTLTYNLRKHFRFRKIEDMKMEQNVVSARAKERLEDMSVDHPVRKMLKGLRDRISREVQAEHNAANEAGPQSPRKGDSSPRVIPSIGGSRAASPTSRSGRLSRDNSPASEHKPAASAPGAEPVSPKEAPPVRKRKPLKKQCSNMSTASVFSASSDSNESPRNIWGKHMKPGDGAQPAIGAFRLRKLMKNRVVPGASASMPEIAKYDHPAGSSDCPTVTISRPNEDHSTGPLRYLSREDEKDGNWKVMAELDDPTLNDLLRLRHNIKCDLRRKEERILELNRAILSADRLNKQNKAAKPQA